MKFMITLHLQPFSLEPDLSHEQASFTPSALAHGMTLPSTGSSCHSSHETAPFTPSSQAQECISISMLTFENRNICLYVYVSYSHIKICLKVRVVCV